MQTGMSFWCSTQCKEVNPSLHSLSQSWMAWSAKNEIRHTRQHTQRRPDLDMVKTYFARLNISLTWSITDFSEGFTKYVDFRTGNKVSGYSRATWQLVLRHTGRNLPSIRTWNMDFICFTRCPGTYSLRVATLFESIPSNPWSSFSFSSDKVWATCYVRKPYMYLKISIPI